MFFNRRSSIGELPSEPKKDILKPIKLSINANRGSMVLQDINKLDQSY